MTYLFKKSANDYASSAKVVDGNLIISLPDAINPVVWRMELGSVKASALEVRAIAADGTFMLTLKTPKGDVHEIAPFATRDSAVHALMQVSNALQNAHGKIMPFPAQATSAQETAHQSSTGTMKWMIALAGVVLVIFLFAYLNSYTPSAIETGAAPSVASDTSGQTNETSGVPESADKMLQGF